MVARNAQVYQGIAVETGRLDNIVELRQRALPNLPFLPANQPSVATLTLKHAYSIVGTDQVEITFIGTDVNVEGEPSTPSSQFDVTTTSENTRPAASGSNTRNVKSSCVT